MDEQIACKKVLTRIALGNAAISLKRGKQPSHKSSNRNPRGKSNNKTTHASALAASDEKSKSKPIICYNCGEEGHIAPKCPNAKQQKRSIATGRTATSTIDDEKAIVCYARVISSTQNSNEIQREENQTVRPTVFPNIAYEENVGFTEYLNCNTYTTIWIETYDHFKPQINSDPKTEVFIHDRPMEEDLIDVAIIFELNLTLLKFSNI